jgi:hypothetical protein
MLLPLAFAITLLAQAAPNQPPPDADINSDEARKLRLDFLKEFRSDFQIFDKDSRDKALEALPEPIQRFSNPVRTSFSDCGLFLWLDGKRPVVVGSVSIRGNGSVWLESATLSPQSLRCTRKGREYWTPKPASVAQQRLMDAPAPAASSSLRLVQMRRLSEQFKIRTEPRDEQPIELRLIPQPLFRCEDDGGEVLDGALFSFAETTDPEALLLLEAVRARGSEAAFWRYTLARMTSRPITARHRDTVVWSVPGYWTNPRSTSDTYQERELSKYPLPNK